MKVIKNIGDLLVTIVLVIGFYLIIATGNSDVTDWGIEEWLTILSMIWIFGRFTLGLLVELIRTVIKDVMKETMIK